MIIAGSLLIVCVMLLLGVSVFVAFGSVLVFIAIVGDQSITGYLPTGSTGIRSLVLLAIPLFMIAGGIMEKGKIPFEEYKAYASQFNPTKYDPEAWVLLAKKAGMKSLVSG